MVHARLYVICGNCGANEDFEHSIITHKEDPELEPGEYNVYIKCTNCSTLHNLYDNSTFKKRE